MERLEDHVLATMETSDHDLLAQYRKGDAQALGRLVERYRRPLFGFILNMTEGRQDADEIFQETWFRAIRSLDSYREHKFLSWLFRIAHNLVIDHVRKAKPTAEVPRDAERAEDDPVNRLPDPAVRPDAQAHGRDLGTRIRRSVAQLPPEQREVFLLRMNAQMPFKEIAKLQGSSINTALARMQYALAKLREELKDDYKDLAGVRP